MADDLLRAGGVIRFSPAPGWSWSGWDGTLTVSPPDRGLTVGGRPVVLPEDVRRLADQLRGRRYTAVGFSDTPGAVKDAVVVCDESTFSDLLTLAGARTARASSRGRFTVTCAPPSFKAGAPPIPDGVLVKTGTWSVEHPGQDFVKTA